MPTFIPKFQLYDTDGETLKYTFPAVQYTNIPRSNKRTSVISALRGTGCIIIEGSEEAFDLIIRFILSADNYVDLTAQIDALETALPSGTRFILRLEKSDETGGIYSYNVIRIEPIEYTESLRNNFQEAIVTLKANAW